MHRHIRILSWPTCLACAGLLLLAALLLATSRVKPSVAAQSSTSNAQNGQRTSVQTLLCAFWRVNKGFTSTIRIKNSLIIGPLEVVPVLYMADGTEYVLPSVTVPTAGVATVNINTALAQAPASLASHISGFGSAAIRYRFIAPGVASASMELLNAPQSLIYVFPFGPSGNDTPQGHTLEGLWWRHDPGVSPFVALTNTTEQSLEAEVELIGSQGTAVAGPVVSVSPHAVEFLELEHLLAGLPTPETRAGGIRIQWTGKRADLLVAAGLENVPEGYSAVMSFLLHDPRSAAPSKTSYGAAGLMVGRPDPAAGFPEGTRFTPYTVLRNTTSKPIEVSPALNYMEGGRAKSIALPTEQLAPYETRTIALANSLARLGLASFSGTINLAFSFLGQSGDLLLATGSVDQTGTYVFEVIPEGVRQSLSKEVCYWDVASGNDTMVTLWNPLDEGQDVVLTFHYGDGSGQYDLPVSLGPHVSRMVTISELIRQGLPDPQGNLIPRIRAAAKEIQL